MKPPEGDYTFTMRRSNEKITEIKGQIKQSFGWDLWARCCETEPNPESRLDTFDYRKQSQQSVIKSI